MTNGLKIGKEKFEKLSYGDQNTLLYENTNEILEFLKTKEVTCATQIAGCNTKFEKLNKRNVIDKGFALLSGGVGGFFATLGKDRWW